MDPTLFPTSLSGAPLYHFVGVLCVISLGMLQERVGRSGAFWQIVWAVPGTILHELSHLLVAAVTGARPVGFSVFPRREPGSGGGRWVLGSVTISRPGPVSALPSALAPLALNLVAGYLYLNWGGWFPEDLLHTVLRYLVVYLFSYSSLPSSQDLRVAFSSPVGVVLYGALGIGAWCYFR